MNTNADITVINSFDGCYYSLFIKGVSMHGKSVKTATEKGLISADCMTIRIPVNSTDVIFVNSTEFKSKDIPPQPPLLTEAYETLDTESGSPLLTENELYWSLIPQKTYIVVGEVSPSELNNITKLLNTREVYTVASVSDNRNGSLRLHHWRCDCK